MLMAVFLTSVLLSCFLLPLPNADGSTEANYLRVHINSQQRSPKSLVDNLQTRDCHHHQYVAPQHGLMNADKIHALPGQPHGAAFDQYAGYVTVDPSAGRALFYYFVESPHDPSTKPLLLWLNGGPGCSSLGDGAMQEMGPFRPNSDGKTLRANDQAWNNVANVIFLESPAGVGFSYSNDTSDYKLIGDERTADDAYTFLINWLERFPQYKTRDFYIAGESYAGHFVPQLASTIFANNKVTNLTVINLKGIALGNAYVDKKTLSKGTYDYYWSHALISDEAHEAIQSKCQFIDGVNFTAECTDAQDAASAELGDINFYDIYTPRCLGFTQTSTEPDPCLHEHVISYLNLEEVQKALHANVTRLPYPWNVCSDFVAPNWNDAPTTMLPTIKDLIASGISVWMYSGDRDALVSVTSTRYFINLLDLPIETSWRPWYSTDGQLGGYVVAHKGLTFATVRGAGHMVPNSQPERALILISSFLQGKLPPSEQIIP